MKHGSHHDNAKAIIYLMIVLLAFGILLVFYFNQDSILQEQRFSSFMTFATVGMGLLMGLLYLVSNSKEKQHKPHAVKAAKGGKAKKKKK